MLKKNKSLLIFLSLMLMISACSDTDGSSPNLVEISSEDENKVIDEEDNEDSTDEEFENNEDSTEEEFEYTPPVLPDLPDPILDTSEWNQVNGPFGGTVTSLFKTVDGYWATTTDNSGFADSNLYLSLIHI